MYGIGIGLPLSPIMGAMSSAYSSRPVLDLNFQGGALDSRITFTRADAVTCATHFDSTGRLVTVAANVARFDYDPAVPAGTTGGELVTNGDFSQGTSGWGVNNGAVLSIVNGALRVTNGGAFGGSFRSPAIGLTVGKTYYVEFDYLGGTSTAVSANTQSGQVIGPFTNAAGRKSAYVVALSTNFFFFIDGTVGNYGDFDNVTIKEAVFTPRGLLIEESRQNLLLNSRDFTTGSWTKTDVTPARTQVGLDGVANTACLMTEGTLLTAQTFQTGAAMTAGSTITGSMVLKRGNTDWVRITLRDSTGVDGASCWFNLNTGAKGAASNAGAGTLTTSTITNLGGGWYRCAATTLPNGVYTQGLISVMSASADASTTRVSGATYIVDCAQLEVGSSDESIVPTAATSLTRARDVALMSGSNFSGWYSQTQGTFVAEVVAPANVESGTFPIILEANDGTASNRMQMFVQTGANDTAGMRVDTGGVTQANTSAGGAGVTQGAVMKVAFAYAANDFAVSLNGGAVGTDTLGTLPTVTQLNIGGSSVGSNRQIYIRSLRYYPTRLANAQLVALTT